MKRALAIGLPIVALAALIGWRLVDKKTEDRQQQQQQASRRNAPATVATAVANPRVILNTLETVGTVDSPYNVQLSPKTAGPINYLEVREGDIVKAGQVLVKIDPAEVEAQVLQAQSQVAEAQSRLSQAQLTQNSTAVGVTSQIQQQRAAVTSANANYDQARENYSAQVAAAESNVTDTAARVAAARSQLENARAALRSAQANLDNANARYSRVESLYKQGFIAAQDVDDARAQVRVQAAAVSSAQSQVNAAQQAVTSAQAVRNAASNQASITRKKGVADVQAAKAAAQQAKAQLQVASANRAQNSAYAANLAALNSAVQSAEAALRQAQARRNDLTLRSPIDGTVTQRLLDPGAIASPGSPVLVIQYLKWVYVTSSVPIEYASQVRSGMQTEITVDGLPNQVFRGAISEVNKSADPQSRQFTIRVKLDNPTGTLRPGMFGHVNVVLQRTDARVAVPREAVKPGEKGQSTVITVDKQDTAHVVPVQTGAQDTQFIQLVKGVDPGTKVVTLTYRPVRDGGKVREGSEGKGRQGQRQEAEE